MIQFPALQRHCSNEPFNPKWYKMSQSMEQIKYYSSSANGEASFFLIFITDPSESFVTAVFLSSCYQMCKNKVIILSYRAGLCGKRSL